MYVQSVSDGVGKDCCEKERKQYCESTVPGAEQRLISVSSFEVWTLTSPPGSKSGISLLPLKAPDTARMKRTDSERGGRRGVCLEQWPQRLEALVSA